MRHNIDTYRPQSGQRICDDNTLINEADYLRGQPYSIARGLKPGAKQFGGFGEREALAGETNFVVWPNGPFQVPPSTGLRMSIVSTSTNDTAGGTGIRKVEIHYLDSALQEKSEYVILNGLTPVLTVATDIRFIQCMHLHEVGSLLAAAGTISAQNAGITYSIISPGDNRCESSARMVPAGKVCYVIGAAVSSVSGTAAARVRIRIVASELDNHQYLNPLILIPFGSIAVQDGSEALAFPMPQGPYSAGTVICLTESTDKNAFVSATWYGFLEDA